MAEGDIRPIPDPTLLTTAALEREIAHLKELFDQRFAIAEERRVELKNDAEKKLEAAFAASKEAVNKNETSTNKQIDGMQSSIGVELNELRRNNADLKERVGRLENLKQGARDVTTDIRAWVFGGAGFIVAIISIVYAIVH